MKIYNNNTPGLVIELTPDDKWWLKKLIEKTGVDLENIDYLEIEFFKVGKYYYPALLFNKEQTDWIEEYSIETIKEILNSKSKVRKNFYYEFI